ncbi:late embryogenesis abundant protein Lea14-A-like [Iris pallida]|uniref:Late embryogenesis abundant protein Lea14-A-like n=1 Tax=Iris pallida TaxID=29817 RepID=A0AAX6FQY5_IRIPA|nr:late embryogenesis abundant protein Lea14-A-like [Iris pallida]
MARLMEKTKGFVADKIAHVKKPEADLTDVSIKHVSRDSVNFHGELSVYNPYSHTIPICEVSYSLKSAGRELVSGTLPDPGSLEAEEKTLMDIPLKVPYDFLISIMRDVGRDWDVDYELYIGLRVDLPIVGNFTIPVTKKGELKLPSLSDIF